jgi:hypothetical protein
MVEPRIVVPAVAGSSPVGHPNHAAVSEERDARYARRSKPRLAQKSAEELSKHRKSVKILFLNIWVRAFCF